MNASKRRILVSLSMGMSIRNLIYIGFLEELTKHYEVILATPFSEDRVLTDFLKQKKLRVQVVPLQVPRWKARLSNWYYKLSYIAHWQLKKPVQLKKHIEKMRDAHPWRYRLKALTAHLYFRFIRGQKSFDVLRDICFKINLNKYYGHLDALFIATSDLNIDQIYAYSAASMKIPVYNLIHSWDNLTARGFLVTDQAQLLVWNDLMKKNAEVYQDTAQKQIQVVGVPQFKVYQNYLDAKSQDFFYEKFKLSPAVKMITYCCAAERVFPDEAEFVEWLVSAVKEKYGDQVVLFLRLHPEERQDYYEKKYGQRSDIRISCPDLNFKAKFMRQLSDSSGIWEFANLMFLSDAVLSLASTTGLDAICLGTPAIGIAFNMVEVDTWARAERHYAESSHYKEVLDFDAIPLARSKADLLSMIDRALSGEDFAVENREKLKQAFHPHANVCQRLIDAITN